MTPALLLVALFSVAPAVQPPITVGVTDTNCGEITISVRAPKGTEANGYGDIGSQPPWIHGSSDTPVVLVLHRQPGTSVEWGVGLHGGSYPLKSGTHVVAPCLAPALDPAPRIVVEDTSSVTITRTRVALWDWILRRFGGAR